MPTVPQEHRRLNSHVQRPFIDKVAPAPAMAERGMPPRLCSCCPCLLECHPPTQQIFTKLLLYTRHWENRDNPRQIWFPPSQGPGMPRKLLLILQNPTPEPSLQCETSLDFPKSEAASSPVLSQPPVTLVVEQREREHRPRTRPVHRTLCWAPHRRCPAPGSQQLRKEETVPLVTDENTDSRGSASCHRSHCQLAKQRQETAAVLLQDRCHPCCKHTWRQGRWAVLSLHSVPRPQHGQGAQ